MFFLNNMKMEVAFCLEASGWHPFLPFDLDTNRFHLHSQLSNFKPWYRRQGLISISMANYNRDFNPFLFPSTSIAYSPVSYSSSSLSSSPPPSQSISSTFQSSSSLPLLPPQYSSSSVHPPAGATATVVPISCSASAVDGAFGATNIVKSPLVRHT